MDPAVAVCRWQRISHGQVRKGAGGRALFCCGGEQAKQGRAGSAQRTAARLTVCSSSQRPRRTPLPRRPSTGADSGPRGRPVPPSVAQSPLLPPSPLPPARQPRQPPPTLQAERRRMRAVPPAPRAPLPTAARCRAGPWSAPWVRPWVALEAPRSGPTAVHCWPRPEPQAPSLREGRGSPLLRQAGLRPSAGRRASCCRAAPGRCRAGRSGNCRSSRGRAQGSTTRTTTRTASENFDSAGEGNGPAKRISVRV